MSLFARSPVTAVLGPTNTGKTHLAIERMCGHASGIIGFPLRLLAREVYDRVVAMKGAGEVGLITGEEKILPANARWLLCTAESMPVDRDAAFVAIDEAQLGADPERGHVFTDRLLRARGREETMILGSDALRPMLRQLVPDAEVVGRPRFSTLSYAGAKKLSRLPRRSAIVAFSAEEVYAVAETLRRLRGGTAVVMGALSPRTRNAQVAMFQAGEVDYLVATDAIGMGLNLDVGHVAFAGLHKFDGRRRRRLTIAEMAQIAGRAGRHQRDGTFGALHADGPESFTPADIEAIEGHHVPRLDHLYWREGAPDLSSVDTLIASLEARPTIEGLRAAPEAVDLAVLKRLAESEMVRARARGRGIVARLWAACGLPDFRKTGPDHHARFVARVFGHLSEGSGHIPVDWFAAELSRLDNVQGDVETIAGRIAAARSWAYIAHRADWLADPAHWAERTRAVEERLSDVLHKRLTQRFVDRRTSVLLRQIGANSSELPVEIGPDGEVMVEEHQLGHLDGFRFSVEAGARAGDKRMLLAAAERHLAGELARRGKTLAAAKDAQLALAAGDGAPPQILWEGAVIATLAAGRTPATPRVVPDRALDCLDPAAREAVQARLDQWIATQVARHCRALPQLEVIATDPDASPELRAVAVSLLDHGGITARDRLAASLDKLEPGERKRLHRAGITIGTLDLFDPRLLKPEAARWRVALLGARGTPIPSAPDGATVLDRNTIGALPAAGFRGIGTQAVRVDLVERIARSAHDARKGRAPITPDMALATSIGLAPATLDKMMARLGFRAVRPDGDTQRWIWRGRPQPRKREAAPRPDNAFAALADLNLDHG